MPRFKQSYPFRFPCLALGDHYQAAFQPGSQLAFQRGRHGARGFPRSDTQDARKSGEIVLPRAHSEPVVPDPDGTLDRRLGIGGIQPREE